MPDPADATGPAGSAAPQTSEGVPAGGGKSADGPKDSKRQNARPGPSGRGGRGNSSSRPRETVIARYGLMGNIGEFRHNLDPPPPRGTRVVLRTERGVEFGEVITPVCRSEECLTWTCGLVSAERLRQFAAANGPEWPCRRDGRVLRVANPQDVIDYRHLQQSAREAGAFCREQIRQLGLEMRLVTVEHLLGGERIVFYFSAEQRVDFRELVRRLAGQYHTRIEMRQVGARDEARLVADYERCGQQCCCQRYLKYLKPVSMRMAKTQKATLDPSKISGRCGRLMCCLRYEDSTYDQLRKRLPRRNTFVRTAEQIGRVVETQILTQLVVMQLADGTRTAVGVEEILERDVAPPAEPAAADAEKADGRRGRPRRGASSGGRRGEPVQEPAEAKPGAATAPAGPAAQPATAGEGNEGVSGGRKRRRRGGRRRQQPAEAPPATAKGGGSSGPAEPTAEAPPTPAAAGAPGPQPAADGAEASAAGPADAGGGRADGARRSPKRHRRRKNRRRKGPGK